jgi:hypothetical protein
VKCTHLVPKPPKRWRKHLIAGSKILNGNVLPDRRNHLCLALNHNKGFLMKKPESRLMAHQHAHGEFRAPTLCGVARFPKNRRRRKGRGELLNTPPPWRTTPTFSSNASASSSGCFHSTATPSCSYIRSQITQPLRRNQLPHPDLRSNPWLHRRNTPAWGTLEARSG